MNKRPILNKITLAAAMLLAGQAHAAGNMSIDINENQCSGGDWWMPCSDVALYDIQVNNNSNQFTVSDNTTITGTTTLNSTLGVSGATTLGSSLSVSGTTTLSNTLNVTGATTINAGLTVAGNSNTAGSATVGNGLTVTAGGATINGTTAITGATTIAGATVVNGTSTLNGEANINASGMAETNINTGSSVGDVTIGNHVPYDPVEEPGGNNVTLAGYLNTVNGVTNLMSADLNNTINAGQNNNINADGSNVIRGGVASHLQAYGEGDTQGYSTYFSGQTVGGTDSGKNYEMRAGNAASQAVVTNSLGASGTVNNVIQGNTLVDGNMYINGTLVYSSNEAATTTVTSGTSALEGATQSTTGQMAIHNAGGATMDANGKLAATGATGASASLTLTNGLGNTHGVVVTEERTTLSGGTQSSSMSLADNGATFSDAATGAPIQVHGVADGSSDFDAVNVRQLYGAVAASMATAPQITGLQAGESGIGIGTGYYGGYGALGIAVTHITKKGAQLNLGVATGLQSGTKTAVRAGVGWKF